MLSRIFTGLSLGLFFILLLIFTPFFYISIIFSLISLYGFYEWLNISKEPITMNILLMIFLMILLLFYHTHSTVIIFAYLSLFMWLLVLIDMYFESPFYKKLLLHAPSLIGLYMIISAWFMIISIGSTSSVAVGEQSEYLMFSLLNPDIKIYLILLLACLLYTSPSPRD